MNDTAKDTAVKEQHGAQRDNREIQRTGERTEGRKDIAANDAFTRNPRSGKRLFAILRAIQKSETPRDIEQFHQMVNLTRDPHNTTTTDVKQKKIVGVGLRDVKNASRKSDEIHQAGGVKIWMPPPPPENPNSRRQIKNPSLVTQQLCMDDHIRAFDWMEGHLDDRLFMVPMDDLIAIEEQVIAMGLA